MAWRDNTHLEVDSLVVLSVVADGPGSDVAFGVARDEVAPRLKLHRQNRPLRRLRGLKRLVPTVQRKITRRNVPSAHIWERQNRIFAR